MLPPLPEAERGSPLLQAGAEILGAINWIQQCDVAAGINFSEIESLFAYKNEPRNLLLKPAAKLVFDELVRFRDWAVIRLVLNAVTALHDGRQTFEHKASARIQ